MTPEGAAGSPAPTSLATRVLASVAGTGSGGAGWGGGGGASGASGARGVSPARAIPAPPSPTIAAKAKETARVPPPSARTVTTCSPSVIGMVWITAKEALPCLPRKAASGVFGTLVFSPTGASSRSIRAETGPLAAAPSWRRSRSVTSPGPTTRTPRARPCGTTR